MKPKDLLQHLEKGDRTMHHLTKKPETDTLAARFSELSGMFAQVYSQPIAQMIPNTWTGANAGLQAQSTLTLQNAQNQQGGIIRW